MSAALRLAESGADVVLLEAQTCGWGASSRNAGYVTNSVAADRDCWRYCCPVTRCRALLHYAEAAVEFTQDVIENRAISACEFEKVGIVVAAVSKGQLRKARRNAKIMAEAGSSAEFVEGPDAGLPEGFLGGIREGIGGTLNPGRYVLGLRDAVLASRARVFEHTRVQDVADSGSEVTIATGRGRVHANQALLTTNACSGISRSLRAAWSPGVDLPGRNRARVPRTSGRPSAGPVGHRW